MSRPRHESPSESNNEYVELDDFHQPPVAEPPHRAARQPERSPQRTLRFVSESGRHGRTEPRTARVDEQHDHAGTPTATGKAEHRRHLNTRPHAVAADIERTADAQLEKSATDRNPPNSPSRKLHRSKASRTVPPRHLARTKISHANSGGKHVSCARRIPTRLPAGPQTTRGKEAFGEALQVASGGDPNVLASNQTPILNADIRGPKQILIGREAVYRVRLQNQSDVPAEGIVATVRIPAGADVVNATATQGMVQQSQDAQAKGQMQWQIARLDRRAGETLEVRLIPRESRPLELGVTWTVAPVGSRAVVEVQEPKLQLEVAGPNEVYFDQPQVFKLTISNPGTGPAENVKIELLPLAAARRSRQGSRHEPSARRLAARWQPNGRSRADRSRSGQDVRQSHRRRPKAA